MAGNEEAREVLAVPLLRAEERQKFVGLMDRLKREVLPPLDKTVGNDEAGSAHAARALDVLQEVVDGLDRWMEDHLSAAFRARDLAGENERLRASGSALAAALEGWHELDQGCSPETVAEQKALIARAARDAAGSILFNADDANMVGEWSRERFVEACEVLADEIQGESARAFRFAKTALEAYAAMAPAEAASTLTNDFDVFAEIVEEVRADAHRRLDAEQDEAAAP